MLELKVVRTHKSADGDIIGPCFINADGDMRYVASEGAIRRIEAGQVSYFTGEGETKQVIRVKRYLTTNPDSVKNNNLDNLPDCELKKA